MRSLNVALRTLVVLAALAGPARADVSRPDAASIQGVISSQLDAFRHDDAGAAFGYAAPELQTLFGNAANFMDMVQRQYRPVYRPRSMDFGTLTEENGDPVQSVELIGPDGLAYTARYTMQRQPDGSWRISACELAESRRVGT